MHHSRHPCLIEPFEPRLLSDSISAGLIPKRGRSLLDLGSAGVSRNEMVCNQNEIENVDCMSQRSGPSSMQRSFVTISIFWKPHLSSVFRVGAVHLILLKHSF